MSDPVSVSAGRRRLGTVPGVLVLLAVLVALSVVVLCPEGLHGWLLVAFLGGAALAVLATRRTRRWEHWLRSAAAFCMGVALMVVVFHSPFTERRWGGLAALVALFVLLLATHQHSRRPARALR